MKMNKLSPIHSGDSLRSSTVIPSEAKDLVLSGTSCVHLHYRAHRRFIGHMESQPYPVYFVKPYYHVSQKD